MYLTSYNILVLLIVRFRKHGKPNYLTTDNKNDRFSLQNFQTMTAINVCCRVLSTGGGGGSFSQKVFLKKILKLFQLKIFFDNDFKESVKVTSVQKCDFSQS